MREVWVVREGEMIRVLGPIDVSGPSGERSVGGAQSRALLGALAIGAGHAVPVDQLEQVLWPDERPAAASNTLQSYISHLRALLGADMLVRHNHAYQLNAGPDDLDALRFEVVLGRAAALTDEPEERLRLCRDGLGLWRGRPFGDLADDEAFRLETYRLEELRLAAMEFSLEAELALGRHELAAAELESAVQEHPYHERLWCLLIEALAGSGRRVEALRKAAELRRVLADVGLDVSDEIAQLERRVLDGS